MTINSKKLNQMFTHTHTYCIYGFSVSGVSVICRIPFSSLFGQKSEEVFYKANRIAFLS